MGNFWTSFSSDELALCQDKVLERVEKHCAERGNAVLFRRVHTSIGNSYLDKTPSQEELFLHSIECEPRDLGAEERARKPPIVILHGYMAGSLMFSNNLAELAQRTRRVCIAVDWLGCGDSSRPNFSPANSSDAFNFFLDSFEAWRAKRELQTFDLIAHSLGGYLSVFYLTKMKEMQSEQQQLRSSGAAALHIPKLVLASPVGFPKRPPPPQDPPLLWRLVSWLWDAGVNPNHVVRAAGPLGKGLVQRAVDHRFHNDRTLGVRGLDADQDGDLFVTYLHQISAHRGSGEHALSEFLHPGAFAKRPLVDELPKLGSQKTMVVFGHSDWMRRDIHAAKDIASKMPNAQVISVPGTHHVYLSNEFNDQCVRFFNGEVPHDVGL